MENERILFLVLKGEYFDDIAAGIKLEEFRDKSPRFIKMLAKKYDSIIFQHGYRKDSRRLKAKYLGYYSRTISHKHFGEKPKEVFAIRFSQVQVVKREVI